MSKRIFSAIMMFLLVLALVFVLVQVPSVRAVSGNLLVNGGFETGALNGWDVGGVCTVSTNIVHSGLYSAYVSDQTYDNWIQQNLTLAGDQDYHLEAWVYPLVVGDLGDAYYPFACVRVRFLDRSSMTNLDVRYAWSWYHAQANISQGVAFLLDFNASQWNLLSRDVTQDARSYFTNVNFSELILTDIVCMYHYSTANPGAFYLDDIALTRADDVAVTNVTSSKTGCLPMPTVGQGYSLNLTVTVADLGDYPETFNLTLYATIFIVQQNVTLQIASQNITLPSGNSTTIAFTWNTTGFFYGNYTISAYALPVPGEADPSDNNFTGGVVTVTIPGDINGDFKVGLSDLGLLAKAYNSHGPDYHYKGEPASPNWNPNADINGDGAVNLVDLGILVKHWNQHYP